VSAVNLVYSYSENHWIHLQSVIIKEDSVSRQSSTGLFGYRQIHLQATIVKKESVSRQSSIDLSRYRWIHLHSEIVKD
jgi:hypothetical protein